MTLDKLKRTLKTLFFYLVITIVCVSLFPAVSSLLSWQLENLPLPESQTEFSQPFDALLEPLTVSSLQQPLPQGYRVETEEGETVFISPSDLLAALLETEIQSLPEGWQEQPSAQTALLMRIIGLHSALLGMMGDRTEGVSVEQLNNICWLTADECRTIAQPLSQSSLEKNTDSSVQHAADTAAGYFLSKDGKLVREGGKLTLEEIYNQLQNGETPSAIWNSICGEGYRLETVKTP